MSKHAKKLNLSVYLADLQQQGKIVLNRILEKTEALSYEVIRLGLVLHKARHHHRHDPSHRSENGTFTIADDSFTLWCEDNFPTVSRASLYNYLRATENALYLLRGKDSLGQIHTFDDAIVDEMREAHLLHGVNLTQLYKPLPSGNPRGSSSGMTIGGIDDLPVDDPALVAQQTWFHAWDVALRSAIDHREHLLHLPLRGNPDKKEVGLEDLKAQYLETIKDINKAIQARKKL